MQTSERTHLVSSDRACKDELFHSRRETRRRITHRGWCVGYVSEPKYLPKFVTSRVLDRPPNSSRIRILRDSRQRKHRGVERQKAYWQTRRCPHQGVSRPIRDSRVSHPGMIAPGSVSPGR